MKRAPHRHPHHQSVLLGLLSASLLVCGLSACSTDEEEGGGSSAKTINLAGSLVSLTGSAREFYNHTVVLTEATSALSRTAVVDAKGHFTLNKVDPKGLYTMALLNTDLRVVSSFAQTVSGSSSTTLRPWFTAKEDTLPLVAVQGPTMRFLTTDAVTINTTYSATDEGSNGVSDGMDDIWTLTLTGGFPSSRSHGLNLASSTGPVADRDKDGLVATLDPDDDNDEKLDIFDSTSDANTVDDYLQSTHDQYFTGDMTQITVTLTQGYDSNGDPEPMVLHALVTLGSESKFNTIALTGAETLFEDAQMTRVSSTGTTSQSDFAGKLYDDGAHEDLASGDNVFGVEITLADNTTPKANQALIFKASSTKSSKLAPEEQVIALAPLTTAAFTAEPDDILDGTDFVSDTITFSGTPFGSGHLEFTWTVEIRDADGVLVHTSAPLEQTATSYDIPSGVLEDGDTYTARVAAHTPSRVSGRPAVIVKSKELPVLAGEDP